MQSFEWVDATSVEHAAQLLAASTAIAPSSRKPAASTSSI